MKGLWPERDCLQTRVGAFSHSLNLSFSFADWAKLLSCGFLPIGTMRREPAIGVRRRKPLQEQR